MHRELLRRRRDILDHLGRLSDHAIEIVQKLVESLSHLTQLIGGCHRNPAGQITPGGPLSHIHNRLHLPNHRSADEHAYRDDDG